ncbi:MAG: MATE family efflux transporter [Pseudomonadota bacterium]
MSIEVPSAAEQSGGELRPLMSLAWPLIGNNLAVAGMNFADAVMAGRLSGRDLAAVAVGNSVWMLFFLAALGTLMAISPLVSQAYGARRYRLTGAYVRQGFSIAVVLSLAIVLILVGGADTMMRIVGIDAEFRDLAVGYVEAIAWGAPAICIYLVMRYGLEGIGHTRPILFVSVLALAANVGGNYVFMYGYLGAPALGAVGCGVASALAMWLMLGCLAVYMLLSKREDVRSLTRTRPETAGLKREILSLGIPIAANVVAEVGLFVAVSLIMGTLSANAAAAHQIAINYASTMFMVPMALASAITVRVGHALGEGRPHVARRRGLVGIGACGAFMTVSALVLLVFKDQIVSIYTTDPAVTSIAVSLLFMAAVFQISDGIQVGCAGALRGYKDTRIPFLLNLTAYWIIGFPLAVSALRRETPSPELVWLGFVVGLSVAAALLTWRYLGLSRRAAATTPP